jgi:iron-sulfur cluster assembly protein
MNVNIDLKLTDSAIKEFKNALEDFAKDKENEQIVRVSVEGGGCSGFMYGLGFVDVLEVDPANDIVEEYEGLKLVVDKKSLLFLDGTTIDWVEDLNQRGFKFNNPNAKKSCGCGKSFGA